MTQRVFDVNNEQDMKDIWDILPDWSDKITKGEKKEYDIIWNTELHASYRCLIKINWHDKTEITRPIQEATEADIGKLCYFWDCEKDEKFIGIFKRKTLQGKYISDFRGWIFHHCRRLTKQEIEELC